MQAVCRPHSLFQTACRRAEGTCAHMTRIVSKAMHKITSERGILERSLTCTERRFQLTWQQKLNVSLCLSRTIVAPLERLKLEYLVRGATGNVVDTVRNIFATGGIGGFWKGNGANILRTAPFKSVNFFAYDTFRKQLLRVGDRTEVTNLERLAAGAAAGVTATISCFPLDTVSTPSADFDILNVP
jgi:hypothetical protein